jgi:hypothetical protein
LDEADTSLLRIQRAHRLKVTEDVGDTLRLAAALHLDPFHFEDLVTNRDLSYDERLVRMRERITRIARVHLSGLGTPWAVVEATAIFLDATLVPQQTGGPAIRRLDAQGYSHVATLEYPRLAGSPRQRVYLHENPLARRKSSSVERRPMDHWSQTNSSAEPAELILTVTGIGDRTVCPGVFSPTSGEGIEFNGVVPNGKTLRIEASVGARIDDVPVDAWITYYRGGQYEFGSFDNAAMALEQQATELPFDADFAPAVPTFERPRATPSMPVGPSEWYFTVRQGVFDAANFDFAVYPLPQSPLGTYDTDPGFDGCCFDFPASAVVATAWDERQLCAFKVSLPAERPTSSQAGAAPSAPPAGAAPGSGSPTGTNWVSRIASVLPRFQPAGVRAYVDLQKPSWILGESILRNAKAAATADATILRSSTSDLYVDPGAPA